MDKIKYVDDIFEIPGIENYVDYFFNLEYYDSVDKMQSYDHPTCVGEDVGFLVLEIISDQPVIAGNESLFNLITQDDISFLKFSLLVEENELWSYCFKKK